MGVVDLDDVLLVEVTERAVLLDVLAGDGLHRRRDEEVLLLQAQGLALIVPVLGIEDLRDDVRHRLLLCRLQILSVAEELHVDGLGALRLPQAQRVDVPRVIARDHHVARHGQHAGIVLVDDHEVAVVPPGAELAAEVDLLRLLRLLQQPRVAAVVLPVVRQLKLLTVDDLLAKDAEVIADGIPRRGDLERRHAVEIARGETAETAVAERRVRLRLEHLVRGEAQLLQCLSHRAEQAEVERVFHKAAPHEKLERHVVYLPLFVADDLRFCSHAALGHNVAQHQRAGLHHLRLVRLLFRAAVVQAQLLDDGLAHGFGIISHRNFLRLISQGRVYRPEMLS